MCDLYMHVCIHVSTNLVDICRQNYELLIDIDLAKFSYIYVTVLSSMYIDIRFASLQCLHVYTIISLYESCCMDVFQRVYLCH